MKKFAVFGNPIHHSQSPFIHNAFARQSGIEIEYQRILTPEDSFAETVKGFVEAGGHGANVTLPFKQQAFDLADRLSEQATKAGAVNTLLFNGDEVIGDNTDGMGLVNDLLFNQQDLNGKRILFLGAGGATRGCLQPVLDKQPELVHVANRTEQKACALVDSFSCESMTASGLTNLPDVSFDIIINGTSASLDGKVPPIKDSNLDPQTFCYDMLYAAEPTAFMAYVANKGVENSADGLGMLVEQAAQSFYLWTGIRPETQPVRIALRDMLINP